MKKIILDTNAYTGLLAGNETILDVIAGTETVYFSIFVMGELYYGFHGGTKESENREILKKFLLKPPVKILNATSETAEIFGTIKNNLKTAGTPIPINDVWIAAHAIETGSKLITFDKHFKNIKGLRIWNMIK